MNDELQDSKAIENLLNDDIGTEQEVLNDNIREDDKDISLPNGKALTIEQTYHLTASNDTKVIFLIGPVACGKTTIETTLYQLFHDGSIEDYYFAGSDTLDAFEQRAFTTRINSNNNIAETPRTPIGSSEIFLHLKLWNKKSEKTTNFLFSDLSGETFNEAIGNVEKMKENFSFLRYADYIISVLDGDLIVKKDMRLGAIEDMKSLLQTLYDAKLFNAQTKFQIVLSKYDLVLKDTDNDSENFIERQLDSVSNFFFENSPDMEIFRVAAMPKDDSECHVGYGIKDLLVSWNTGVNKKVTRNNVEVKSEMNKLKYKLLGEKYE